MSRHPPSDHDGSEACRHRDQRQAARSAGGPASSDLDDLIFSWRRIEDPKLRHIALNVIRSMSSPA